MVDLTFVQVNLAIGGYINNDNHVEDISQYNFTHIFSLQEGVDDSAWLQRNPKTKDIHYTYFGVPDDHKDRPVEFFKYVADYGKEVLGNPNNRLYLHCAAGRSRSASAAYTMLRALGYSQKETRIIVNRRPEAYMALAPFAEKALIQLGYIEPVEYDPTNWKE